MRYRHSFAAVMLGLLLAAVGVVHAQATAPATGTTVSGVVRDSIARRPLAGATVQLVAPDSLARLGRSAITDSLGRYTLTDVEDGRYTLGFFHPLLDSLGVEPPAQEVRVEQHHAMRVDLATPSAERIRAAVCGVRSAADSAALLLGVVRDARTLTPAAGVKVAGEWMEIVFSPEGVQRHSPRLIATTGENGWFAICNVPRAGTMFLIASKGADSTDMIEVQVPNDGFLRRELFLGTSRTRHLDTSAPAAVSGPPATIRVGDGHLRGVVTMADGTHPIAGALVRVAEGIAARTNAQGEWTIVDAPEGTRVLEVRALGYYPDRRTVDVSEGAAPVRVALSTLTSVLDTVRISASRLRYDSDRSGFKERARSSGAGRFITAEELKRRPVTETSDIFRNLPGVRLMRDSSGFTKQLQIRGMMADWCTPAIYINGGLMLGFDADEIDALIQPEQVKGVEIYTGPGTPGAFQQGMTGCGTIVLWTR
jgi:hypothetical protein